MNALDPAQHICPALVKIPSFTLLAALAKSASGKTICGFFPPDSRSTLVTFFAADSITCFPVSADPVNTIPSTCGSDTSAPPTSAPDPVTILTTPLGIPEGVVNIETGSGAEV